jgi:uncharacterized membrane protein YjjP (DUF1212 family)
MPATIPDIEPRQLNREELAAALHVLIHFGEALMRSGAPSFRTMLAIERMAAVLQVEKVEAMVIPTGILASVYSGDEHRTQLIRIHSLGVDMNKIYHLEDLSRTIQLGVTPAQLEARINAIQAMKPQYKRWQVSLVVGLACGSFSVLLGGGPFEFMAAFVAASIAQLVRVRMVLAGYNPIPITTIVAAISTLISSTIIGANAPWLLETGLSLRPSAAIIASVLLCVPGVPLVAAIIDITRLDMISGAVRGLYAVVLLVSIALGMLTVLLFTGIKLN